MQTISIETFRMIHPLFLNKALNITRILVILSGESLNSMSTCFEEIILLLGPVYKFRVIILFFPFAGANLTS